MLYIFNQAEQLQAILKPDTSITYAHPAGEAYFLQPQNPTLDEVPSAPATACPYYDAVHSEKLTGENTFSFSVPADHPDSLYIVEGNLVAFKDLDANWQLFEIKRVTDVHGDGLTRTTFCEHAFYELIDDFIEDLRPTDCSANFAITQALAGTRWQPGMVADLGLNSTNYYYEPALSAAQKVANTWKGELQFRVVVEGGVISARYVDLLARRGADTGKQFAYSKDIKSIEREVDLTQVATALYGRGKGVQVETGGYGRRLTFADVVWTTPTNPADKPAGQEWVGDPDALAQWGRPGGRHRFGTYDDPEETDAAKLLQKTWEALQERKNPRITYRLDVADLERLSGYEHEKVRLGDTVRVIDRVFSPPLLVEARIIEINRDLLRPENTRITLGNFAPTIADENLKVQETVQVVRDRQGVWDTAAPFTGPVPTDWLDGIIDTLQNEVRAGNGTVTLTDNNGILIVDNPTTPTKALRLLGGLLAISNSKDAGGNWIWRTFGTGDGFTADEMNAGKIRTSLIQIFGNSNFYWDGDYLYIVNPANLNEQIRLSKEGIRFTKDGGTTWRTALTFDGLNVYGDSETGYAKYREDGTKVYDQAGNLRAHLGWYETLGDQTATFSRSSVAYKQDGTQVAANHPRYEYHALSSFQGIMVEESTSNLVRTNAGADPLFNSATGWTFFGQGASIANGVLTLKSTDGTTVSDCQCTLTNLAQNTKHSFLIRARYKDTTGTAGSLQLDLLGTGYDNAEQELGISTSQLTTTFQNFKKDGFDSQAIPSSVQLRIFTFSTRPIEVEFVQLEQKAYATTVTDGTRSPESLTIPTAGVFQKGNWTVKLRYTPTSAANLGDVVKYLWSLYIDANNRYEIIIGWYGDLVLKVFSGGTGYVIDTAFNYIVPGNDYYITVCGDGSKIRLFVNGAQIGTDTTYVEPVGTLPTNMYIGCAWNGTGQANGIISDFAVMSRAQTLAEHQAEYQSGQPLPVDEDTTYLMSCNGHLQPTVRRFGLWSKNGEISLVAPPVEGGIRVYDASGNLRAHIGQYAAGKYGAKVINGEIYSTLFRTGTETDTDYILLSPGFQPLIVKKGGKDSLIIYSHSDGGYVQLRDPSADATRGFLSTWNDIYGTGVVLEGWSGTAWTDASLKGDWVRLIGNVIWLDPNTVTDVDAHVDGNLSVWGNLYASGSKPAMQQTKSYGLRCLYARESPDIRYVEEGIGKLVNGECRIDLDPIFLECIEENTEVTPWIIHITPYADIDLYVAEVGSTYFVVRERNNGMNESSFSWSLSAVRAGYAGVRFEEAHAEGDILSSNWEDEILSEVES